MHHLFGGIVVSEKIVSILVGFLSLISVLYSSFSSDLTSSLTSKTPFDISFVDVSTENGSVVLIREDKKGVELQDISLSYVGDYEVISYEIENLSSKYDADVFVTVNGEKYYSNDYITIECSDLERIDSGKRQKGWIRIELVKASLTDISFSFDISFDFQPVYE